MPSSGRKLDRRKGAIVSVEKNRKEAELEKINNYMQMIVAQAICKEITKEEMKQIVGEMYDTFHLL